MRFRFHFLNGLCPHHLPSHCKHKASRSPLVPRGFPETCLHLLQASSFCSLTGFKTLPQIPPAFPAFHCVLTPITPAVLVQFQFCLRRKTRPDALLRNYCRGERKAKASQVKNLRTLVFPYQGKKATVDTFPIAEVLRPTGFLQGSVLLSALLSMRKASCLILLMLQDCSFDTFQPVSTSLL